MISSTTDSSSTLPLIKRAPLTSSIYDVSTPTTLPLFPESFTAACSHPPGAHPKSTTLNPGPMILYELFNSSSLYVARLLYPCSFASLR